MNLSPRKKIWLFIVVFIVVALTIWISFTLISNHKVPVSDLKTVDKLDLKRYLGVWYEIARYPFRQQEGCTNTKVRYSLRDDGKIRVENMCDKQGSSDLVEGQAWPVDTVSNSKLKVQFFWPFAGDYWVIEIGENYEYAVIGHPKRTNLWILSRTPTIEKAKLDQILARTEKNGYQISKLIWTQQIQTDKPFAE